MVKITGEIAHLPLLNCEIDFGKSVWSIHIHANIRFLQKITRYWLLIFNMLIFPEMLEGMWLTDSAGMIHFKNTYIVYDNIMSLILCCRWSETHVTSYHLSTIVLTTRHVVCWGLVYNTTQNLSHDRVKETFNRNK